MRLIGTIITLLASAPIANATGHNQHPGVRDVGEGATAHSIFVDSRRFPRNVVEVKGHFVTGSRMIQNEGRTFFEDSYGETKKITSRSNNTSTYSGYYFDSNGTMVVMTPQEAEAHHENDSLPEYNLSQLSLGLIP